MRHLPLEQRALLMRLYVHGSSQRQMAARLGVSRDTVRRYVRYLMVGIDITDLDAYSEEGVPLR